MITPREYVDETKRISPPRLATRERLALYAVGGSGEMGEVCEIVKKHLWHDKPMVLDDLLKEVGDVLWYMARLLDTASEGKFDLADAMERNIVKLRERHPNGWHTGYQSDRHDGEKSRWDHEADATEDRNGDFYCWTCESETGDIDTAFEHCSEFFDREGQPRTKGSTND